MVRLHENKQRQNAFKRILAMHILIQIILLLENNLSNICSKISNIGMNL